MLLLIDCAYFVVGFTSKIMMNLLEARNFNHDSMQDSFKENAHVNLIMNLPLKILPYHISRDAISLIICVKLCTKAKQGMC